MHRLLVTIEDEELIDWFENAVPPDMPPAWRKDFVHRALRLYVAKEYPRFKQSTPDGVQIV